MTEASLNGLRPGDAAIGLEHFGADVQLVALERVDRGTCDRLAEDLSVPPMNCTRDLLYGSGLIVIVVVIALSVTWYWLNSTPVDA